MQNFERVLYEALMFAFGKILAKYNTFAQASILKDVGKEIIDYLNSHGFEFEERGELDDLASLTQLFCAERFCRKGGH